MGRHTADTRTDRDHRQGDTSFVIGERRAARQRTTSNPAPAPRAIAPVSVAANRVSDAAAARAAVVHAEARPVMPTDPRIVRRRRTVAQAPSKTAELRGINAFVRRRASIPALSFLAVSGLAVASLVNPMSANAATAAAVLAPAPHAPSPQQYTAHGTYGTFDTSRDGYEIIKPAPKVVAPVTPAPSAAPTTTTTGTATGSAAPAPTAASTGSAPAAATPDPGSAKAIALQMVTARGWGNDQYSCLVSLWTKESGWNVAAYNPSGAYGIPQSLPGSKMASVGADWQTNPATQITWGLNYITGVYGTPCGAWGHSQSFNWY